MSIDDINQAIAENPNILCDGWKLLPSGKWRNSCHVIREGMPRATGGQGSYIYPNIPVIFDGADSDTRMSFAAFYAQLHHLPFHHGNKTSEQINDNHRVWHELAGLVGGTFDINDKGNVLYEKGQQGLDAVKTLYKDCLANMRNPIGEEIDRVGIIRGYFRHIRGWSDNSINNSKIGVLRASKAFELNLDYRFNIAIPIMCDNEVVGLKFRNVNGTDKDKYRNMEGTQLSTFAYIRPNPNETGTAYLCEGELDAIRANLAAGIPCFASQGGANMKNRDKLLGIKQRGWTSLTIIADNDVAGLKFALEAAIEAEKIGLEANVVRKLSDDCKDIDEFLGEHSRQEFISRLNEAKPYAISEAASLIEDQSGMRYHEFFKYLSRIYTTALPRWHKAIDDILTANEKRLITLYNVYAKDVIKELSDTDKQKKEERLKESVQKIASYYEGAAKLLQDGESTAASMKIEAAKAEEKKVEEKEEEEEEEEEGFDETFLKGGATRYIRPNITLRVPNVPDVEDGIIEWGVPIGGITTVAARTGHGKSRFLENLLIDATGQLSEDSCIMYFALEEIKINIYALLISIVCNRVLTFQHGISNTSIIKDYAKGHILKALGDKNGEGIMKNASKKIDAELHRNINTERTNALNAEYKEELKSRLSIAVDYVRGLYNSGRLVVEDDIMDIEDVAARVKRASEKKDVKLIFLDYIQLFGTKERTYDSKQRMAAICKQLIKMKKDYGAAVVCAAQLNRQVTSPLKMDVSNIADASDIEHCCDEVILLYNSAFNYAGNEWETYDRESKERLENAGFTYGTPGAIYIRNAKSRSWGSGGEAVIRYNGRIGSLWQDDMTGKKERTDIADMEMLLRDAKEKYEGTIHELIQEPTEQEKKKQEEEEQEEKAFWQEREQARQQAATGGDDVFSNNTDYYNIDDNDNDDNDNYNESTYEYSGPTPF